MEIAKSCPEENEGNAPITYRITGTIVASPDNPRIARLSRVPETSFHGENPFLLEVKWDRWDPGMLPH